MNAFRKIVAFGALGALSLLVLAMPAFAALEVEFSSITPETSLRDLTIPPQDGVELFVFEGGQLNTEYTAVFNVNEEPASVVLVAADMVDYSYDAEAGTVSIVLEHVGYVPAASLPGPDTDFSIAFIGAVADGQAGPPAAMRGSWMATNIGPSDWELIPPTLENPSFGYKLSGPDGETGFFRMFVPQAIIDLLSQLYGESVSIEDLAVFNDDQQASMDITPVEPSEGVVTGALVDINVVFSSGSSELPDDEEEPVVEAVRAAYDYPEFPVGDYPQYPGDDSDTTNVQKEITVERAQTVSLSADDSTPVKGSSVTIYGWVQGGLEGQKVKITSANALKRAKAKGGAALTRYQKRGWKTLLLDNEGYFSHTFTAKKTDTLRAIYKVSGQSAKKSNRLKIRAQAAAE